MALSGLKCINCERVSHTSCVKLLKNIKLIDSKTIICCSNTEQRPGNSKAHEGYQSDAKDTETGDNLAKMEIFYLNELLKRRDKIVETQQETILALKADKITKIK